MAHPELNKVHYIYRHIRLDKDEVFYIGIGKKTEQDVKYGTYHRADSKRDRSNFWYRIINKTDYKVEILLDDLTEIECKKKEKEFILLYGRRDLKKGTLCNLTDGGDGSLNLSIEVREKLRKSKLGGKNPNFGKMMSESTRKLISENTTGENNPFFGKKHSKDFIAKVSKIVVNLENGIFYDSIKEASSVTKYKYKCFKAMLNGQSRNKTSFSIVK